MTDRTVQVPLALLASTIRILKISGRPITAAALHDYLPNYTLADIPFHDDYLGMRAEYNTGDDGAPCKIIAKLNEDEILIQFDNGACAPVDRSEVRLRPLDPRMAFPAKTHSREDGRS